MIDILILPNEIIELIFQNLNPNKISNIIKKNVIKKKYIDIRHIASNRIKLFIKLINKYNILKNKILIHLEYLLNRNLPIRFTYPFTLSRNRREIIKNSCVYYAPVVPNYRCRFCSKMENEHLIKEKIIINYYYPLFSKVYLPSTIMYR